MTGSTVHIPVLETGRLRLRAHIRADFDAYAALFASPRAAHMGQLKRRHAWYSFTADIAGWILDGHGAWAIETRNGTLVGQVALNRPDHFPELELGWFLLDGQDGRGYATEAARAALGFARETLGRKTVVSYIAPANASSIRLATRLGARPDPAAPRPDGDTARDTTVYRHDLGIPVHTDCTYGNLTRNIRKEDIR